MQWQGLDNPHMQRQWLTATMTTVGGCNNQERNEGKNMLERQRETKKRVMSFERPRAKKTTTRDRSNGEANGSSWRWVLKGTSKTCQFQLNSTQHSTRRQQIVDCEQIWKNPPLHYTWTKTTDEQV